MKSISIATLNIGAASKERARRILDDWVLRSDFDVYVFTESSEGAGTDLIASAFLDVGWSVLRRNTEPGDRGTIVASRIRARDAQSYPSDDPAPGRAVVIELETDPQIELIAMYVPNRGNEFSKTDRKKSYLDSWLKYLSIAPHMHHRILIGDLNVVPTEQKPTFLPQQRFEYDWYSKISRDCGLYDAAVEHNNAGHENTWVAHLGEGYTYDHILIERALRPRVLDFHYDHLPRSRRGLTDHSALSIVVAVDAVGNLETVKVGTPRQGNLF